MLSDRISPKMSLPEARTMMKGRYRAGRRNTPLMSSPVPIKYEVEIIQNVMDQNLSGFMRDLSQDEVYFIYRQVSRLNNDLLIPMGYYFDFDNDGIDYAFTGTDGKTHYLERVKAVRYFYGISSPKKKKDIVLPYVLMTPNVKIRVLKTDRREDHTFQDRGARFDSYASVPRGLYQQQKKHKPQSGLLTIPKRMKATARQKATSKYVFKKKKSYPIGDLYHARKAINMVLWPSNEANRLAVLKAVVKAYPKYDWKSYWEYKRSRAKNKSKIQSYDSLL